MERNENVRVRIAPSPTGFFHVGTARTGLYNWLFAQKTGGYFYLRIEDTDQQRSAKEYEENILEGLHWLGMTGDGDVMRQSDRRDAYRVALERLFTEKKAFYCHHTQEELKAERQAQEAARGAVRHVCDHKHDSKGTQEGGVIRLAVDETSDRIISFNDQIRGQVEFRQALLGDFSIARSLDDALYHFAVVIDDAEMKISHVIRGEDHISNTPKQILIYEALGFSAPIFAHLPLLLRPDRSKLSKRDGTTAVIDYRKDYLPQALVNFLAGLSYTFSKEIISPAEMAEEFELGKIHKSGAIFDIQKLNWMNAQYIKRLSPAEFRKVAHLNSVSDAAVPLITERLEKLTDAEQFSYLWAEPTYDSQILKWKDASWEDSVHALQSVKKAILAGEFTKEHITQTLENLSTTHGNKGIIFWPLRVALSGKEKSPGPIEIAMALGKKETIHRLEKAITVIQKQIDAK